MSESSENDQEPDLTTALETFLASGFHAASIAELEAATGYDWQTIRQRYGDKEGLFYAATDQRIDTPTRDQIAPDEARRMLARLREANKNPRLRAIHKQALARIASLTDANSNGV